MTKNKIVWLIGLTIGLFFLPWRLNLVAGALALIFVPAFYELVWLASIINLTYGWPSTFPPRQFFLSLAVLVLVIVGDYWRRQLRWRRSYQ